MTAATDLTGIVEELDVLVRARYPIIAVETHEEERLRLILEALARSPRHESKGLFVWSRPTGLTQIVGTGNGPKQLACADPISVLEYIAGQTTGLYLLADFAPFLAPYGQEDATLVRMLRELAWQIKTQGSTIIISGPHWPDITTLSKEVRVLELPLPDESEVSTIALRQIDGLADNPNVTIDMENGNREHLTQALLGLTTSEIENALASATIRHRGLSQAAIPSILEEKRAVIRQSGALTYTHPEPASYLGGYSHIRKLLTEAAATFSPAAREFGVEPSKGLLLVGLPGTGKDLTKKIASSMMGRPLLDLDFGSVMGEGGGIIGQAEMSVKRALQLATTLKGILGISEFEKAVGGLASSGQTDGGTTARTIGHLLNWMQEQQDVFVIATANDVRGLRPEQIRQGRFSNIVFVDLPDVADRADIFRVHLERRKRDPQNHDLQALAAAANGFSGAEIEAAVKAAILDAWMQGGVLLTDSHILKRIGSIRPTSEVKREEIEELRKWAKEHLVVSSVDGALPEDRGRRLEI